MLVKGLPVKGLAAEFAQYSIRVNALEPGFIYLSFACRKFCYCSTDIISQQISSFTATEQTGGMEKRTREYQAQSVPLRRFAEPHEQADSALFLFSPNISTRKSTQLIKYKSVLTVTVIHFFFYDRPRTLLGLVSDPMVDSLITSRNLCSDVFHPVLVVRRIVFYALS